MALFQVQHQEEIWELGLIFGVFDQEGLRNKEFSTLTLANLVKSGFNKLDHI